MKTSLPVYCLAASVALLSGCATAPRSVQSTPPAAAARLPEAASPVDARYVAPSSERQLAPGEKIDHLFTRGIDGPFVLQRIGRATYWAHHQFYNSLFYVGDTGVLLIDPLQYRGEAILKAIRSVTTKPITAIAYSHFHVDHIDDARVFLDDSARAGVKVRIIASQATADKMRRLGSSLPMPTETTAWPLGSFRFEGLTVEVRGYAHPAHVDDSSSWRLIEEGILHAPDMLNPDQLPFHGFGGSENFVNYEANLHELERMDWRVFSGGHGNVGGREDFAFYFRFLTDARAALQAASAAVDFGPFVDPAKVNNHFAIATGWNDAVIKHAMDALRPRYGRFYGFEAGMPANLALMLDAMESYH